MAHPVQSSKIWTALAAAALMLTIGFDSAAKQVRNSSISIPDLATHSIFKVECTGGGAYGTAFLHRSGNLITAAHVLASCTEVKIMGEAGEVGIGDLLAADSVRDLAVIHPRSKVRGIPIPIRLHGEPALGERVAVFGFPTGYAAKSPLLAEGYVAGQDVCQMERKRTVISGAINHGMSGGPIIDINSGEAIGVAASKIIGLSKNLEMELDALLKQHSGVMYSVRFSDGNSGEFTEAQIVGAVLRELTSQVQLVIGCALTSDDLRTGLKEAGVDP